MIKPIVKWVGGKRRLMTTILEHFPSKSEVSTYVEPFIGGGAMTFGYNHNKTIINDINSELINMYKVIRDNPTELIEDLKTHKPDKSYYYSIRAMDRDFTFNDMSNIKKASRLIYILEFGFNGLYRINMKGYCNTSYGKYDSTIQALVNQENVFNMSEFLKTCEIHNGQYNELEFEENDRTLVYMDPPYILPNGHSYSAGGFDMSCQISLKEWWDELHSKGCKLIQSNSHCNETHELYKEYNIEEVDSVQPMGNSTGKTGSVKEVIIKNF